MDRYLEEIEARGFAVAEGMIEPGFCDDLVGAIEELESHSHSDAAPGATGGGAAAHYFDLLNCGDIWQHVAAYPQVLRVVRAVLGQDCLLSRLGTDIIGPGGRGQPIHCDDSLYAVRRPHRNLVCSALWALRDFTADNGATRVVPKSHALLQYPRSDEQYEAVPLEMPKGSIGFIVGTCYQGSGANNTGERRWGLSVSYCDREMRQQENLMLAVLPDHARTFSPTLRRLIGHRMSRPKGAPATTDDERFDSEER